MWGKTTEEVKAKTDGDLPQGQVKGRVFTQVLACLVVSLSNMSATAVNGWTSLTLPSMMKDPAIELDTASVAWIASIISIGCMVGCILSGMAMDWLGRRNLLLVMAPVLSAGWVTMALAPNTAAILVGRFICGLASGFVFTVLNVYCTEVSEARLRGRLGIVPSLFTALGFLLSYTAGSFFSWRISCYVCLSPLIIMFIILWAVPESPYWYLLKGRNEDCKASLQWLRGPNYDSSSEIAEMREKLDSVGSEIEYREFLRPRTGKPILISLFLATSQQVTAASILLSFTGMVFISAGVEDPQNATLMAGFVPVVFQVLSLLLGDHFGRRALFISSTLGISVAVVFLGLYFLMINVLGINWPTWVPVACVMIALASYCVGGRTIPPLLSAELFNTTIRSTASSIYMFYNRILGFITAQVFPFFEEAYGLHTVFLTFGGLSLIFTLISVFVVPETKGKTLEEIQEVFESTKKKKKQSSVHSFSDGHVNKAYQETK